MASRSFFPVWGIAEPEDPRIKTSCDHRLFDILALSLGDLSPGGRVRSGRLVRHSDVRTCQVGVVADIPGVAGRSPVA